MKNVTRVSILLAFAVPFSMMAQTLDKKAIIKSPYQIRQGIIDGSDISFAPYPGKMPKSHFAIKANYRNAQTHEPMRFPYQDPAGFYSNSCPISLANGQILMVWTNQSGDTVYCASGSDGGVSWGRPIVVAATSFAFSLTGVRTNTGRVIVVWGGNGVALTCFSDDHGASWTPPASVASAGVEFNLTVTQTIDGKLWLAYNRFSQSTGFDIYFRTSIDNGSSWSTERTFVATSAAEFDGAVVSGSGSTLYAFYDDNSSGNLSIYRRTSTDGGNTWSPRSPIVNSSLSERRPRVLRQSADTLWMTYERREPSTIPGYSQLEIYYTKSMDGGISWSTPVEFTRYAGNDRVHNADLVNDLPFVSFTSDRWASTIFQTQIWYGIIGTTMDNNPPPVLMRALSLMTPQNFVTAQAYVDDETGIADVKISYLLNGLPNGPFQMYDDGQHNDGSASDNIWGTTIGPFQIGDAVLPAFAITDISSNAVEVNIFQPKIKAVHNAGNVTLSFDDNSQLAEGGGAPGTSARWPRANGQDYLYLGGLWVGTNVGGENRMMNRDYSEFDWNRTPGTPYTLAPGVSDQDGSVTYDDQSAMSPPIGLRVHQQSYQWSAQTRDDFIVFKYTIRNLGTNGNLSNVFVSPWLDPDVTVQTAADNDRVGYDSQRRMIYVNDSQNNPGGYIGLKLLGAGKTPHTVHAYNIDQDPDTDEARYQYLANGTITIPTEINDYRVLLTAPPFSLTAGDSATVAYGIVMGIDLSELQVHADTLEAIYGSIRTGVAASRSDQIPTSYALAQNYPNPFNPGTKIEFALPRQSFVTLKVYNLFGEEVATLVEKNLSAGFHQVNWEAGELSSGVYFYRLQAGDPATGFPNKSGQAGQGFAETRKLVLVK